MLELCLVNRLVRSSGHDDAIRKIFSLSTLTALVIGALPLRAETPLQNNDVGIAGPIEARLAYTDANGNSQDYNLRQLPGALSKVLPANLLKLQNAPLLQPQGSPQGYFDQLWSTIRNGVCGDVEGHVKTSVANAYAPSCQTLSQGLLTATIANGWEDQYGFTITGSQLVLEYEVPLNTVTFYVHTNCTCNKDDNSCKLAGGQEDPQFTALFYVHLFVKATNPNMASLTAPPADLQTIGEVLYEGIDAGDTSGAYASAGVQFLGALASLVSVAATTGPIPAVDVFGLILSVEQFVTQVGGIILDLACNNHLRDDVSSQLDPSGTGLWFSNSLRSAKDTVYQDFNEFFQGLYAAQPFGFTQLGVTAGDDGSLIFRVTYPAPVAPTLVDDRTQKNPYQGLIQVNITANPPAIPAGQSLIVTGSSFSPNYSTALQLDWNKTVWGKPQTSLYEALFIPQQSIFVPLGVFPINAPLIANPFWQVTGLSPSTMYQFMVRECDQITCAPWSNLLTTSTVAAGSHQVALTFDGNLILCGTVGQDCPIPIGNATLGPDGGFTGTATIPGSTSAGLHTITATVAGQHASTQVVVCDPKGCPASLWLLGPSNDVVSEGGLVYAGSGFTLEGFSFSPSQTVDVTFDSPQGLSAGFASVGTDGSFKVSFAMPVLLGTHKLVASSNGQTLATSIDFKVDVNH
jgi:hypothetical protein